jgi:hypothetical protein
MGFLTVTAEKASNLRKNRRQNTALGKDESGGTPGRARTYCRTILKSGLKDEKEGADDRRLTSTTLGK